MVSGATADRGGRSPDLRREARRLARLHGRAWLAELDRAARLGDVTAAATLLTLALQEPARQEDRR